MAELTFEQWLSAVRCAGGSSNVMIVVPGHPRAGGRYLSSNEEGYGPARRPCADGEYEDIPDTAWDGLRAGDLVSVGVNLPGVPYQSPPQPYSRDWVMALAGAGIQPNDWGSLVDRDDADGAYERSQGIDCCIDARSSD